MEASSYRPRNAGHDYYGRGTYLITLVVSGRERLLSRFVTDLGHKGELALTPLGKAVEEAWLQTPACSLAHGNKVVVHACVCMPDHFHGVIEVMEPMAWSLGDIIQGFKASCTSWWQREQGLVPSVDRPIAADCRGERAPVWLREKAAVCGSEGALVRGLSKKQRQEYYAFVRREQRPLFDDNYDDTVCLDERHRQAMIAYVHDNPRRAVLRRLLPDYLRRCLHVEIDGRRYGAFGNLFLLRWPRKLQVMCHRRAQRARFSLLCTLGNYYPRSSFLVPRTSLTERHFSSVECHSTFLKRHSTIVKGHSTIVKRHSTTLKGCSTRKSLRARVYIHDS